MLRTAHGATSPTVTAARTGNAGLRPARAVLRTAHGATSPTATALHGGFATSSRYQGPASLSDDALTYTADAHTESMVPEIDAAQTRPIVIEMRRVDQEWHAHPDHMELRPDPLAYDPAEGIRWDTMISDAITPQFQSLMAEMTRRFDEIARRLDGIDRRLDGIDRRLDGIDRRLDGIDRRLNEQGRKLDKLIAQTWVLLALMGVALILELAILGLLLTR